MIILYVFFFFKQKTAYEMRISDWSSDVCSSACFICDAAGEFPRSSRILPMVAAARQASNIRMITILGGGMNGALTVSAHEAESCRGPKSETVASGLWADAGAIGRSCRP